MPASAGACLLIVEVVLVSTVKAPVALGRSVPPVTGWQLLQVSIVKLLSVNMMASLAFVACRAVSHGLGIGEFHGVRHVHVVHELFLVCVLELSLQASNRFHLLPQTLQPVEDRPPEAAKLDGRRVPLSMWQPLQV